MINSEIRSLNASDLRRVNEILNFDERTWRLSYLKKEFKSDKYNQVYEKYVVKVNHGYLVMFLFLQSCIFLIHMITVFVYNLLANKLNEVIVDLAIYLIYIFLPIITYYVNDKCVLRNPKILKRLSILLFLLLFGYDTCLPIYHYVYFKNLIRPCYTTVLILACYIFYSFSTYTLAGFLALIVTMSHLIVLGNITYKKSTNSFYEIGCDTFYLLCLNALGAYFRYIYDIMNRKHFLDRRMCIESNLNLQYQKEQEMQFISAILPKRIIDKVLCEFHRMYINKTPQEVKQNYFGPKFIETHDNVTILYADIVNYTQMTTKLTAVTLVMTLNELFGSFDEASEVLKVNRIKFLGDCYYCVAGLPPDNITNHADASVQLGIEMIAIIKKIRDTRNIAIDMRIGIHTGKIIGGIIGHRKFQYDVWSKDVYIANRMESTGVPSKIHLTKQTLDQLSIEYNYIETEAGNVDPFLMQHSIKTFLINPPTVNPVIIAMNYEPRISANSTGRDSNDTNYKNSSLQIENDDPHSKSKRSTASARTNLMAMLSNRMGFMNNKTHKDRLDTINEQLTHEIENLPLSKIHYWRKKTEISPLLMNFKICSDERKYLKMPDSLFAYYLITEIFTLFCIFIIQMIIFPYITNTAIIILSIGFFLLFILLPLTWVQYFWNNYYIKQILGQGRIDEHFDIDSIKLKGPNNKLGHFFYILSRSISENVFVRTMLYLGICVAVSSCVLTEMMNCEGHNLVHGSANLTLYSNLACKMPWHITQKCALTIIMSFLFFKIHSLLKFFYAVIIVGYYSYWVLNINNDMFKNSQSYFHAEVPAAVSHILTMVTLTVTLIIIERQSDYMNRLTFLWNKKLNLEITEASHLHQINRMLLTNILPIHVAEEFFADSTSLGNVYFEEYKSVSVMFASIVNLSDDYFKDDYGCLSIMHSIVSEFDKILLMYKGKIEKIKIANWTYMAASGLLPGEKTSTSEEDDTDIHLIRMVYFASDLLKAIDKINTDGLMEIKLRIGICHGEVTAGVVGCKKPFYDIWGSTVNFASRLDSTGVPNKIQLNQESSEILARHGYACSYRDLVYIKGISEKPGVPDVPTYFVSLNDSKNLRVSGESLTELDKYYRDDDDDSEPDDDHLPLHRKL